MDRWLFTNSRLIAKCFFSLGSFWKPSTATKSYKNEHECGQSHKILRRPAHAVFTIDRVMRCSRLDTSTLKVRLCSRPIYGRHSTCLQNSLFR